MHWSSHWTKPRLHSFPQLPAAHTGWLRGGVSGHALPHAPQFTRSVFASTHTSPQRVSPGEQSKLHALSRQVGTAFIGALHAMPQPPQFAASVAGSMQLRAHSIVPPGHARTQFPAAH